MMVSKRTLLFQGLIFRFHVKLQGCKGFWFCIVFQQPPNPVLLGLGPSQTWFVLAKTLVPFFSMSDVQSKCQPNPSKSKMFQYLKDTTRYEMTWYCWEQNGPISWEVVLISHQHTSWLQNDLRFALYKPCEVVNFLQRFFTYMAMNGQSSQICAIIPQVVSPESPGKNTVDKVTFDLQL